MIKWKSNIKLAYEQYKYMDRLLSNPECFKSNVNEKIIYDLWTAIKKDLDIEEKGG